MSLKENDIYLENLMEGTMAKDFSVSCSKKDIGKTIVKIAEKIKESYPSYFGAGWLARHDPDKFDELNKDYFGWTVGQAYWDWYESEENQNTGN